MNLRKWLFSRASSHITSHSAWYAAVFGGLLRLGYVDGPHSSTVSVRVPYLLTVELTFSWRTAYGLSFRVQVLFISLTVNPNLHPNLA